MDPNLGTRTMNFTTKTAHFSFGDEFKVLSLLQDIQLVYYPLLAIIGVPVNLLAIIILSQGKCGLSKCVTRYLVAMASADLLVVIIDLIMRQIPISHQGHFPLMDFLDSIRVCNIHAVVLYAVTDCSVWFTVTFTIDRYVAICCQKLKEKYCKEKTAAVVLGMVTVLFTVKDIFWYFMLQGIYWGGNYPYFCVEHGGGYTFSPIMSAFELLHLFLTPFLPFILILLLNALTVRHVLQASRARKRLRAHGSGESPSDPEMKSRRKSLILLFIISANFILLWAMYLLDSVWERMGNMGIRYVGLPDFMQELGFMFQLLSCCTNTGIYCMTQTKFREQLVKMLLYPCCFIVELVE
ncbi:probable G-protein coupled receptor 139 [Scyliorhinus canicula]|uniref:probable G-protein coupled receptor 139 n=1 Tax=Scyliorhinus canicula TaxID=7830 RepID=UPI0018F3B183|nr:probable G-protein coupled receptor 139 [Scyliorhinus canicula]